MKTTTIAVALLAVLSLSCKQTVVVHDQPYLGEIRGRVIPLDVDWDSLPSLLGGTTVWLKDTKFSTTTDANGNWTLKEVPAGIYSLLFTRPGFDTSFYQDQYTANPYRFSGAGVDFLEDAYFVRIPTDTLTLDSAVLGDTNYGYGDYHWMAFGVHTSSTQVQRVVTYCSIDTNLLWEGNTNQASDYFTVDGKFSCFFREAVDPIQRKVILLDSIPPGHKLFVTAELYPCYGYRNSYGMTKKNYSKTIVLTTR